jgi:hypothetical protein
VVPKKPKHTRFPDVFETSEREELLGDSGRGGGGGGGGEQQRIGTRDGAQGEQGESEGAEGEERREEEDDDEVDEILKEMGIS